METGTKQRQAAKRFADYWQGKGYEKGQSQPFWLSLLREVYGIAEPERYISFENQVHLDNTSFIDGYIESTHVMIEQKSLDKDLNKPTRQSDGRYLTPYQQAKRYSAELSWSKRPRWIVTSNFESFLIYDMEHPGVEPQLILLKDLPDEFWRMEFLVDDEKTQIQKEKEVSENAGTIVRQLYDALSACYGDMEDERNQKSLNKLIVRLVFCLYAEDAELFGHGQFQKYINHFDSEDLSDALFRLFEILDTKEEERRKGLKPILAAFPYTNGGLFHDKEGAEDTEIPFLSEEVKHLLVDVASPFNWAKISPTIFGGIFESTLNPETRRAGGMHYTSIENIHKVIDPLFLDDLKAEFKAIVDSEPRTTRKDKILEWRQKLASFQKKLASLKFLDPACGSGNFLTETYLSLRRLENEVIRILFGEGFMGLEDIIKVSIQQFYGIEINDFAVSVATTALWISEAQMLRETESIITHDLSALPLKNYSSIHEGNALRMDWNNVVQAEDVDYIMGNPPFLGYSFQTKEQKEDMLSVYVDEKGKPYNTAGKIDYVAGWFFKSAEMMTRNPHIRAALVSTNSITQGEQVAYIWKPLINRFCISIDFAYKTFRWDSEANQKAHVHCVIIGFSTGKRPGDKQLFDGGSVLLVSNINPYLIDSEDILIESRSNPICDVPAIVNGNKPVDGGFLFMTEEERAEAIHKEPQIEPYIRRIVGSVEFINNKTRYCIWLKDVSPSLIRNSDIISKRVAAVRGFRLSSTKEATRKSADYPMLFQQIRQPESDYILIPRVSSETRRYVPMGFLSASVITNDSAQMVPNAGLYHFGIITSAIHMAWMRVVCGRLEMRYRYSAEIVYNNFPWPNPTDNQKAKIEQTAQGILDARALYPESSLADLYDELAMPPELRKAHRANDAAVLEAYGFPKDASESEIVARLFKMYQELTHKE